MFTFCVQLYIYKMINKKTIVCMYILFYVFGAL